MAPRHRARLLPCCASDASSGGSSSSSGSAGSSEAAASSGPPTKSTNSSSSGSGGSSSGGEPPSERRSQNQRSKSGRKSSPSSSSSWLSRLFSGMKLQQPLRIALNIAMVMLLMRFWPVPGGRSPLGQVEPVTVQVAFSEFVKQVQKNEVQRVVIDSASNSFTFSLRPSSPLYKMLPESLDRNHLTFTTIRPADYPTPYEAMLKHNIQFSALDRKAGRLSTLMTYAASALVVIAVLNRLPIKLLPQRGAGRRHASAQVQDPITFDDVAGVDEAKEELKEIVDFLRYPEKFTRLGARPPSGVLLVGPPGTGKTLLARAVAGEAGVPFFAVSASEFVELFVGRGAARIRELFAEARKKAPCVVFIDELDAVGGKRGIGLNEERDQTLNQLLTELDGFEARPGVLLLAATNRPDVLDSALMRPGRLSRKVVVPLPDEEARASILGVHLRRVPLASQHDRDLACEAVAKITSGFSGAELANVVNEAAFLAARNGSEAVGLPELVEAVQRTRFGVNGGAGGMGLGLTQRMRGWLTDAMGSSNKTMRVQPFGS